MLMQNFPEYFEEAGDAPHVEEEAPPPSLFEDFSGQPTAEEMAEFTGDRDVMPENIDVSSDDMDQGGVLAAVITGPHGDADDAVYRHPRTGAVLSKAQYDRVSGILKKPHLANEQSARDKKQALRARAAAIPKRSVRSDEAGNPVGPTVMPVTEPTPVKKPMPSGLPGFDDDGFSQG